MASIQHLVAPLRKLCQPGVRAHVLVVLLIAVFILGLENSTIFLPLDPAQKISRNVSDHKPAEDFAVPVAEPVKEYIVEDTSGKKVKADISSNSSQGLKDLNTSTNSSLGKEKNEILDGKFSPPANEAPVLENDMMGSSEKKAEISSNSSPGQENARISNGTLSSPTNGTLVLDKENKESPASNKEIEIRDCAGEKNQKRRREEIEPVRTIREMSEIMERNRRHSCSPIPSWSSPIDREILRAKREILNAPILINDSELYPPVYRNFSTFKRSYELMEEMLKVYVYKEGKRPIFHESHLWGIYAAEGWFMKHMEGKNRFLVDDPTKAHLFFIPFSATNLRYEMYVPGSHDMKNLIRFLNDYVGTIVAKYPFWNRTGGADHFSVACHDWASKLTALSMGDTIRALCNADLGGVFELGKDVSITLTRVPNPQNPMENAGGKPGRKRDTLAFFSGKMHGHVRPLLFQHWGNNTDPDILVFNPLPEGGRTYVEHMKSSKFCLCPSGYEVNSPRLGEALFYECVPVTISDNFVPPLFEVLNWEAFSLVVPVKDIPKLKEILLSVSPEKYLALQKGVKKVHRHFLWHLQPERYDLFHMTLHSVWFNRVFQFRDMESSNLL